MSHVKLILDCDASPPLDGIDPANVYHVSDGITFTRIPGGMASGQSSVGITAPLPDGKHIALEVSLSNLSMVLAGIKGAEQRQKETDGRN